MDRWMERCPFLNMTCAACSVCLQLCPGASACDNYTVSRPGLVLLKKHQRLIELAVFLEFRLPFCPNAQHSGDDGRDLQLAGETVVWGARDTEKKRAKEVDVTCSTNNIYKLLEHKFPQGLSYFRSSEQQTGVLHWLYSVVVWISKAWRTMTAAEIFSMKHRLCRRASAKVKTDLSTK